MFIFLASHTLIFILYISPLQPDESPPVILFFLYILSTQPLLNNPISTTYPISNLSTQLSHPKCSGYVSAQYNKQKIRKSEQFFQIVQASGNPLFSALFRYSISPPVTSTRHTQHVIVRLFANISISAEKPYFLGFRQLFYLINLLLLIRLFHNK